MYLRSYISICRNRDTIISGRNLAAILDTSRCNITPISVLYYVEVAGCINFVTSGHCHSLLAASTYYSLRSLAIAIIKQMANYKACTDRHHS